MVTGKEGRTWSLMLILCVTGLWLLNSCISDIFHPPTTCMGSNISVSVWSALGFTHWSEMFGISKIFNVLKQISILVTNY